MYRKDESSEKLKKKLHGFEKAPPEKIIKTKKVNIKSVNQIDPEYISSRVDFQILGSDRQ